MRISAARRRSTVTAIRFATADARQLSSDTQIYEIRRHQVYDRSGVRPLESLLEFPQAIAASFDVENMHPAQQAIEDGCGQHLVAGEQFGVRSDDIVSNFPIVKSTSEMRC